MIDQQLRDAFQQAHPEDLRTIAQYIRWVKLRRRIHAAFYQKPAHWITALRTVHWI